VKGLKPQHNVTSPEQAFTNIRHCIPFVYGFINRLLQVFI